MKLGTKENLQFRKKSENFIFIGILYNHYKFIFVVHFLHNEYICPANLRLSIFFKLYFPLFYNPENGTEASVSESDSHLSDFLFCITRTSSLSIELRRRHSQ